MVGAYTLPAMARVLLLLLLSLLLGCPGEPEPEPITDLPNQPGGNPLVPDVALYPYPSDLYLVADSSTATGRSLELPAEALPQGLSPGTFEGHDGYSRVPAMLAWFIEGVDPASLPDAHDPSATTSPDSPVLLVEEGTDALIPLLVELDANARGPFEQALILRPHRALRAGHGYSVLLRNTLRSATGGDIAVGDAFRALRDGIPTDSDAVEAQRADFQIALDATAAVGWATEDLLLAWTFHTRSEEQVVGPLLAMQEVMNTVDLPAWSPVSEGDDGDDWAVRGTFEAPEFLDADNRIRIDADGLPIQQGTRTVEFTLAVPDTVDEPRPVICYGHGFFSHRDAVLGGSYGRGLQEWEMSSIAINFRGFSEDDLLDTAPILSGDLDRVPEIIDKQVVNVATFTLMARLVREQLAADVTVPRGDDDLAALDADRVHYMGISNGGTQGLTIMSTSPIFERGVLVVPGGGWTHMMQRAVQWTTMADILESSYTPLELQVTMGLMQNLFDPADSLNYVEHLTEDRFDGRTDVAVTLHQAVDDSQVSNLVTDWVARTADVPLVVPSPRDIWGLDEVEAQAPDGHDGPSAMFVYDLQVEPPPEGNVPPEVDSGSHGEVRNLDVYNQQVGAFLEDGSIVQVCDGPCDPE